MFKKFISTKYLNTKSAFTLAEVLITLAVIGVVAAMAIPSLKANIDNKANKSAFKKSFSVLNNAFNLIKNEQGGTLKGYCGDAADYMDCLAEKLQEVTNVSKICLESSSIKCWHGDTTDNNITWYNGEIRGSNEQYSHASLILSDGTLVSIGGGYHDDACESTTYSTTITSYKYCDFINIDVNGFKKPNRIGYDIFMLTLTPDGINIPDLPSCSKTGINRDGVGYSCAKNALIEE